jgi:uncharacterized membrane protein
MAGVVKWLFLLTLTVWLGGMVFFSLIVAPVLFRTFPVEQAGTIVGAIFPWYYGLGYACGGLMLVTSAALAIMTRGSWRWAGATGVAGVMLAATLYAGLTIQPRAAALRPALHMPDASPAVRAEFDQLHRRAVQLNGAVLVGGLMLSILAAGALRV